MNSIEIAKARVERVIETDEAIAMTWIKRCADAFYTATRLARCAAKVSPRPLYSSQVRNAIDRDLLPILNPI